MHNAATLLLSVLDSSPAAYCEATLSWPEFSLLLPAPQTAAIHCPAGLQTSRSRVVSLSSVPMLTTQVGLHLALKPAALTTADSLALLLLSRTTAVPAGMHLVPTAICCHLSECLFVLHSS